MIENYMKQSNMLLNYGYERLLYNDKRVPRYFDHGEAISEIRNLKLRLLNEDIDYKINYEYLKSIEKILNVTNDNYQDYIFTGSIALNIYGLINRNYKDVDIILPKDFNIIDGTFNQVTHYPSDNDGDFCSKRMGFRDVKPKIALSKTVIKDIFSTLFSSNNDIRYDLYHDEDDKVKYNTFRYEGKVYRIQDICQLMEQKNILLSRYTPTYGNTSIANEHYYKHYYDMNFIYNNLAFKKIK